jgi:hypothetical protein
MLTTDASTDNLKYIYCMVWINNMVYPQLYDVLTYNGSIFQTIRALVYVADIKYSRAGYKTSPTMWSLCSGPI